MLQCMQKSCFTLNYTTKYLHTFFQDNYLAREFSCLLLISIVPHQEADMTTAVELMWAAASKGVRCGGKGRSAAEEGVQVSSDCCWMLYT